MKEDEYRRRNIRKAWQVWMAMPPEQRKRRQDTNDPAAEPGPLPPDRDEEAQDQQRNPREIWGQGRAFGGDAVAYYQEHYAGLTRGQLHDQAPRFYDYLRRHRLLGHIPLKARVSFPDPLAFYREHCAGMTRRQAALAERQFYSFLQRHGLLNAIPFAAPAAADHADRDARLSAPSPARPVCRPAAQPAAQRPLRRPSIASARLECFRVIPD